MDKQERASVYHFGEDSPLYSSLTSIGLLMLLIVFSALLGMGIIAGLSSIQGIDFQYLFSHLTDENNIENRNYIRLSLLINHLTMFVIPSLFFGWFLYRKHIWSFFQMNQQPKFSAVIYGILILLLAFPFVQFTFWLNQQIPLPSWAQAMEDSTKDLIEGLLLTERPYELFFNLFIIAVIPALGEELIFRGILQKKLYESSQNPMIAIWVTAFIFSAFHMQFEGFIPRMILGALLGYLYFWTGNLWVPIIAHFFNNAIQIVLQFLYAQEFSQLDIDNTDQFSWGLSLFSFVCIIALGIKMKDMRKQEVLD